MATLNIASKANQATIFPALLVAYYAKEADPNASININFEELEAHKSSEKATVELVLSNAAPIYGSEDVISSLIETYPFLRGKSALSVVNDILYRKLGAESFTG